MKKIGKAVNNRYRGMLGQGYNLAMFESTNHNTINITGENPSRIFKRFAAPNLSMSRTHKNRLPAKLKHTDLKRDPGTGRRFFKNHSQAFTRQDLRKFLRCGFKLCSQGQK